MEQLRVVLAPMEGLTDFLMRQTLTEASSYAWCVTEFLRITQQLLPESTFLRHMPELYCKSQTRNGTPVHLQLLGNEPQLMAESAARAAELGAAAVDINFGCPAKTVNKHRGGAALLNEPELIYKIMSAVRQAVPKQIPVSAKIRLGIDNTQELFDNVAAVAQANSSWLTIHARTKSQGYRPPVDWRAIADARCHANGMPLIANGDIVSVASAHACRDITGCSTLMVGRAAVSQPGLINQINRDTTALSWPSVHQLQQQFLINMQGNDSGVVGRYKQWLAMTALHYPEAAAHFNRVKRIKTRTEMLMAAAV